MTSTDKNNDLTTDNHLPSLDGLRAIAVILVTLSHNTPNKNPDLGIESIVFKISYLGWAGVDLFFILSGFLITRILLRLSEDKNRMFQFYKRRGLRIIPAYMTSLILVFLIIPMFSGYEFSSFSVLIPYLFYVSNFPWIPELAGDYYFLGHFWSLAVEMQFYLLFPLVIYYCAKEKLTSVVVGLYLIFVLMRVYFIFSGVDPYTIFSFTPFRLDSLFLGALIAINIPRLQQFNSKLIVLVFVILSIYLINIVWYGQGQSTSIFKSEQPYLLNRILLPTAINIYFCICLFFALTIKQVARPLSASWLGFIAKYSYGIYIYHYIFFPLTLKFIYPTISSSFGQGNTSAYIYFFVTSIIATLFAYMSYHAIEKHFLRIR